MQLMRRDVEAALSRLMKQRREVLEIRSTAGAPPENIGTFNRFRQSYQRNVRVEAEDKKAGWMASRMVRVHVCGAPGNAMTAGA
jgi:hypothetical protein